MNYIRKYKLETKTTSLFFSMVIFISAVYSCEITSDYMFLTEREKSKNLLGSHIQKSQLLDNIEQRQPCALKNYFFSCFSFFFFKHTQPDLLEDNDNNSGEALIIREPITNVERNYLSLPPEIILKIATFLDPFSQLKLSQINKKVRSCIDENFWAKQIHQEKYYIWNSSLPKAQVFLLIIFTIMVLVNILGYQKES